MEKLSEAKRSELKKMSDVNLVSKLIKHGLSEEAVEKMKREELLNAWAELVLTGIETKKVKGAEGDTMLI